MQIESLQHSSRILTGLHGTERNRWNEGRGKKARGTGERKELVRVGPSQYLGRIESVTTGDFSLTETACLVINQECPALSRTQSILGQTG